MGRSFKTATAFVALFIFTLHASYGWTPPTSPANTPPGSPRSTTTAPPKPVKTDAARNLTTPGAASATTPPSPSGTTAPPKPVKTNAARNLTTPGAAPAATPPPKPVKTDAARNLTTPGTVPAPAASPATAPRAPSAVPQPIYDVAGASNKAAQTRPPVSNPSQYGVLPPGANVNGSAGPASPNGSKSGNVYDRTSAGGLGGAGQATPAGKGGGRVYDAAGSPGFGPGKSAGQTSPRQNSAASTVKAPVYDTVPKETKTKKKKR